MQFFLMKLSSLYHRSQFKFPSNRRLPENGLCSDVTEVEHLLRVVSVQCNDIDKILVHQAVIGCVYGHVPDVVFISENDPGLHVVPPLASVFIGRALVPVVVALAVEASRRVLTLLAADLRGLRALVYVLAGLAVVQKLVPRIALAVVARRGVNTFVPALIHLHPGALVYVTVGWLVTLVSTVWILVADQSLVDTVPIGAHELPGIGTGHVLHLRRCTSKEQRIIKKPVRL